MKLGIHVLYIMQILPFKGFDFRFIRIFLVGILKKYIGYIFLRGKSLAEAKEARYSGWVTTS